MFGADLSGQSLKEGRKEGRKEENSSTDLKADLLCAWIGLQRGEQFYVLPAPILFIYCIRTTCTASVKKKAEGPQFSSSNRLLSQPNQPLISFHSFSTKGNELTIIFSYFCLCCSFPRNRNVVEWVRQERMKYLSSVRTCSTYIHLILEKQI
jgi:hypothetical protein